MDSSFLTLSPKALSRKKWSGNIVQGPVRSSILISKICPLRDTRCSPSSLHNIEKNRRESIDSKKSNSVVLDDSIVLISEKINCKTPSSCVSKLLSSDQRSIAKHSTSISRSDQVHDAATDKFDEIRNWLNELHTAQERKRLSSPWSSLNSSSVIECSPVSDGPPKLDTKNTSKNRIPETSSDESLGSLKQNDPPRSLSNYNSQESVKKDTLKETLLESSDDESVQPARQKKVCLIFSDSDSEGDGENYQSRSSSVGKNTNASTSSKSSEDSCKLSLPCSKNYSSGRCSRASSESDDSIISVSSADRIISDLYAKNWNKETCSPRKCNPQAHLSKNEFKKNKDELCTHLFKLFNAEVFENKLPFNLRIDWNVRMKTTAGFCCNSSLPGSQGKIRSSIIELSTKVCNTPDRVRDTLIHELCHAASWIIDGVKTGHGAIWQEWAKKAMMRFPELPRIERCHSYSIQTKYTYKCKNCGHSFGRHSKSLDLQRKRCGYCYGEFDLLVNTKTKNSTGVQPTPKKPRAATGFALYVKENYRTTQEKNSGLKHAEIMKLLGNQFAGFVEADKSMKGNDLQLVVFIAMHCSVLTIDHLGILLRRNGKSSKLENLKLHRTKCSQLISVVHGPSILKEVVDDIANAPYGIIVDESTEVSSVKFLALCVTYYSTSNNKMVTDCLGLVEVPLVTAEALYAAFTKFLETAGLILKNMTSLGTDGANNLCGKFHSLYALLKKVIPQLILIRCICHTIDNCASKACDELPCSLEFLIRESKNYFANIYKRKEEYSDLYKTMNDMKEPPQLVKLCTIWWLIWYPAVKRILEQWLELKTFFTSIASSKDYTVRQIANLIHPGTLCLNLTFLKPVLQDVNDVNLLFQATHADVTKLYGDLRNLIFSLASRVIKQSQDGSVLRRCEVDMLKEALSNSSNYLHYDRVDLGIHLKKMASSGNLGISSEDLSVVRERCTKFLVYLTQKLLESMPSNIDVIQKLRFLASNIIMAPARRPNFEQLPLDLAVPGTDMDQLEGQWRALGVIGLKDGSLDFLNTDVDTVQFWGRVRQLSDATGRTLYKELADFALKALTLPVSNAIIELVFSIMNAVKTRIRNKMQLQQVLKICCVEFQPTDDMFVRFNSKMYALQEPRPSTSTSEEDDSAAEGEALSEVITLISADQDENNICHLE